MVEKCTLEGVPGSVMISSLAELVTPLTRAAFVELVRTRTPRLVKGAGADGRYALLLDWRGLMEIVLDGTFPAHKLRVTQRGAILAGKVWRDGDRPKAAVIEALMTQGASIVAYDIDPSVPAMAAVARAMAAELGEHVLGSAIATTGDGGALDVHYDEGDLTVLQVEGSKRWLIYRDAAEHPIPGMPAAESDDDGAVLLDIVLDPGDLLFVPAGYRHRCENAAERSLHLGFFLYPLTAIRALDLVTRRLSSKPDHRRPLRGPSLQEDDLKRRLIAEIEGMSLNDLLERHRQTDPFATTY